MKKRNDKKNKLNIRNGILRVFILLVAVTIVILWLMQTVFLDTTYKFIKTREIKSAAEDIVENFNSTSINRIALQKDFCANVYDTKGNMVFSIDTNKRCAIHRTKKDIFSYYNKKVFDNKGEYVEKSQLTEQGMENRFSNRKFSPVESIICAKLIRNNDTFYLVVIDATISPLDATVSTLRYQLIIITFILILLALIISFYFSKKLSKPIVEVSNKAKGLATGEYKVEPFDGGYEEINELVSTLDYASEELEKNERYRKELMANISHDLRTPLTMIIGYSELLRDFPEEANSENLQIIIDEAKRLTNLVNDTMDLSKYEAGVVELNKEDFSITKEIDEIMNRLSTLTEYNIGFDFDKDVTVNADQLQISQVIYNFVTNAINHTGEDKIINIKQELKDKKVYIYVSDTGEGIEKDKLPDIWQRYYKIDKTHKRAVVGSGLGLSIVKTILERHGALYGVDSEVGKGSTFWFALDVSTVKDVE